MFKGNVFIVLNTNINCTKHILHCVIYLNSFVDEIYYLNTLLKDLNIVANSYKIQIAFIHLF